MTTDFPQPTRWPLLLLGLVLGAAAGAGVLWYLTSGDEDLDDIDTASAITVPVAAESRDLISYIEWDGTLSSGASATVAAATQGTITRNSAVGDTIVAGDIIAEIDGESVIALYGSVPQFRALNAEADSGADVRQLEENLVALGFDPDGTVTVDDVFTYNTGLMVERWEAALGFEDPDATIAAGQLAFIDGPSEVVTTTAVGAQAAPGQALLTTATAADTGFLRLPQTVSKIEGLADTATELTNGVVLATATTGDAQIPVIGVEGEPDADREDAIEIQIQAGATIVDVLTSDAEWVEAGRPLFRYEIPQSAIETVVDVADSDAFTVGTEVDVELPDSSVISATVTDLSVVARTVQDGQDTSTVVDVVIQPTDPLSTSITSGPVVIRTEDSATLGAVVIPVRALIAFVEGGHGIDFEDGRRVAVELGAFDDGWVEITNGAVQAGDTILAPA